MVRLNALPAPEPLWTVVVDKTSGLQLTTNQVNVAMHLKTTSMFKTLLNRRIEK